MSVVLPFASQVEKTARENLLRFIKHTAKSKLFQGPDAQIWADNTWDLRSRVGARGHMGSYVLHFVNFESTGCGSTRVGAVLLEQPFRDAAKALVTRAFNASGQSTPYRWLMALRALENAFRELGKIPDISTLNHPVLDRAAEIVSSSHNDQAGYGAALEQIARFMEEQRLCMVEVAWRNLAAVRRDQRRSINVQADSGTSISEKLPHLKCILDLSFVFSGCDNR